MVKKIVVKKYSDEVSEEKWLEMKEVKKGEGRTKKVNYNELLERLVGCNKGLTVRRIGELMMDCSAGMKTKVYYSEVLRVIEKVELSEELKVERKVDKVSGILYYKFSAIEK